MFVRSCGGECHFHLRSAFDLKEEEEFSIVNAALLRWRPLLLIITPAGAPSKDRVGPRPQGQAHTGLRGDTAGPGLWVRATASASPAAPFMSWNPGQVVDWAFHSF